MAKWEKTFVCEQCLEEKPYWKFAYDHELKCHEAICTDCFRKDRQAHRKKSPHILTIGEYVEKQLQIRERWRGYPYLVRKHD